MYWQKNFPSRSKYSRRALRSPCIFCTSAIHGGRMLRAQEAQEQRYRFLYQLSLLVFIGKTGLNNPEFNL